MKIFDQYFKSQGKMDPNSIPSEIPILPLRNSVLYPGAYIPLSVGRKKSVNLVEDALKKDKIIGVVTQRSPMTEDPLWTDVYGYGTAAKIVKTFKVNQDTENLVVEGLVRFKIVEGLRTEPYHFARIEVIPDSIPQGVESHIQAIVRNLKTQAQRAIELSPNIPDEAGQVIENVEDPNYLAYLIAGHINIAIDKRQEILETVDLMTRLQKVMTLLQNEVHVLELTQKINFEVRSEMDKNQREYYLREQLKAIRKELGETDDRSDEMDELRAKIEKANMPEDAKTAADNELKRLSRMSPASSEYTVSRTYLDWLVDMPWSITTKDTLEIKKAEAILNEDHYGLDKVKKRILEYLAVRKLKPDMKGPILCLVGPPGVGKTSLGKSVARALERKFVRMSLGGVRDEAEIRGHRRTYVGALPGKVVQGIKRAGSNNPVFILDEVDKIGSDFRGDPSSALLEVLDPEQNNSFQDHYLDVHFDLSKVFFIATANQLDPIPAPLRDRMEVIEIPGYTAEEKLQIAKKYLVPRQLENHALQPGMIEITEDAINDIIHSYTREAGLRNFERELASVCRAVAKEVASREEGAPSEKIVVSSKELHKYLGQKKFILDTAERLATSGVATGLAWTPVGGDILFIEATIMTGKGGLQLTGQLGDVMKESAQAALSFVRANASKLGIPDEVFQKNDLHIHVPAGAIQKDGPSAGVTMLAAITSLLTSRPVRSDTAMTGEITLRGNVLPVGGIKEKVLAARRAGIKRIVMCKRNEPDVMEMDEQVRKDIEFVFITRMEELFQYVLVPEADIPALMKPPSTGQSLWPTRIEAV